MIVILGCSHNCVECPIKKRTTECYYLRLTDSKLSERFTEAVESKVQISKFREILRDFQEPSIQVACALDGCRVEKIEIWLEAVIEKEWETKIGEEKGIGPSQGVYEIWRIMKLPELVSRKINGERIFEIDLNGPRPKWIREFEISIEPTNEGFMFHFSIRMPKEKAVDFKKSKLALKMGKEYILFHVNAHNGIELPTWEERRLRGWLTFVKD